MTALIFVFGGILFAVAVGAFLVDEDGLGFFAFAGGVALCCFAYTRTDIRKEQLEMEQAAETAAAAQEQRERAPQLFSEADGCKVYRFRENRDDRWHYVTRCTDAKTTTDTTVTTRSGKTTKTHIESLEAK